MLSGANPTTFPLQEFGNRRKRRRTSSPTPEALVVTNGFTHSTKEPPKEWEYQLRAAAYGEHPIPMHTSEPTQTLEVESVIDSVLLSKTHKDTSSLLQVEITNPSLGRPGNKSRSPPKDQPASIAPKKMIAICAGGKLVSYASQSLAPNPNARRRKRDITHEDDFKPKIVKIRYGSTDESRKLMAQKIQEIISSTTVRVNDEIKNPRSSKPAIISKPTHPFFLGATSRNTESKGIYESIADGDLTSSKIAGKQNMDDGPNKANSVKEIVTNPNATANPATLQQISHSFRKSGPIRYRGAMESIWPPKEMMHVQPLLHNLAVPPAQNVGFRASCARRKLKYAKVHIAGDKEILHSYSKLLHPQATCKENFKGKTMDKLGRPSRKVMTGSELQAATRSLLSDKLSTLQPVVFQDDASGGSHIFAGTSHNAILRLYKDIHSSSTAFDRFECETHDWIHKYAPKCAEEVLQSGPEALVLRDWLKSLTITSVGSGNSETHKGRDKLVPSKNPNAYFKRKKRKRAEELDGFVISSDEETVEMEELARPEASDAGYHFPGKKSVVRAASISGPDAERQRAANAIVISGPHGCGKTAAVYAVARELDFEVFEINPGSRRSGKDILEKVGDMTKNHLVNQAYEIKGDEFAKEVTNSAELSVPEVDFGCRNNVNQVLQPCTEIKKKRRGRPRIHVKPLDANDKLKEKKKGKEKEKEREKEGEEEKEKEREKEREKKREKEREKGREKGREKEKEKEKKKKQSQRQSLILLEEVDVLFEEDKQFWSTTLDLILNSKRPIIMTCTDERLLPLDEMILFALLRFTPPPEPLAIDCLILIASSEGHILSRKPLSSLLRSKHFDLRASITELNFFCQMAIGDTKGGLEWMLIQPSSTEGQTKEGTNLRVVSVDTYGENLQNAQPSPERKPLVNKAGKFFPDNWKSWNVDGGYYRGPGVTPSQIKQNQEEGKFALQNLIAFEQVIDAFSAADTHPFSDYRQNDLVGGMNPSRELILNHTEAFRSNSPRYFRKS